MQNVKQYYYIKPSIKTDHSLLTLNLNLKEGIRHGPGFWKFNTSLLIDKEYIDYIKEIISQLEEECIHTLPILHYSLTVSYTSYPSSVTVSLCHTHLTHPPLQSHCVIHTLPILRYSLTVSLNI